MNNIRSPRGRWCILSPCYPWTISTEYKKYPSLLNFLYDDGSSQPTKLLLETKPISQDRIVIGIKYLLKHWPRYKNYLFESPENIKFVNPTNPIFEKDFNDLLKEARIAIKKYKIKGKEVIDKQSKLEMMGAKIVGDEATFDYNAKDHVDKAVYGIETPESLMKLNIIGKMISSYIYLFDKIPEFLISTEENPSIFYAAIKTQPEQIAKILCAVEINRAKQIDMLSLKGLLARLNEHVGYLWPYIVFPTELHSSIKKSDGLIELENKIKYHIDYNTPFKNHIQVCLEMLNYSFSPKDSELLRGEIRSDGTDSEDESGTSFVETLEISIPLDEDGERNGTIDDIPEDFIDKWVIDSTAFLDPVNSKVEPIQPVEPAATVQPVSPPQVPITLVSPPQVPITPVQPVSPPPVPITPVQPVVPIQPVAPIQPPIAPVIPVQPVVTPPVTQPSQVQEVLSWEKRFSKITQTGHVVEGTNPLSPFGKNPVFWKSEKYENMLSVLYNEAIKSVIGTSEQTFKNSATKAKSMLQAYNKSENVIIWFKDKGIEILKELVNSPVYKQRKEQMSMANVGQITFLFSRMKKTDLLLEPWVGVIKVENGIPFHNMAIGGWNCAWQVQN